MRGQPSFEYVRVGPLASSRLVESINRLTRKLEHLQE